MWKNRIVAHGDRDPAELKANPLNWRVHSKAQAAALSGVLEEIGLVQSVILNQRTGRLLDGHLRVELALAQRQSTVPVTVVDLSEEEERLVLATLDPLGVMASQDADRLRALLGQVEASDKRTRELLARLAPPDLDATPQLGDLEYRVIVSASDEGHQTELLERFREEGLKCKALIS